MQFVHRVALLIFLMPMNLIGPALGEEIPRLPDGRYLVQVKDVLIALPEEEPTRRMTTFDVSTPPGKSPFEFTLTDLVGDPNRYAPRLRSSDWSSVRASPTRPREILGEEVMKGVIGVGVVSGLDTNCEAWLPQWARYREVAMGLPADQYGWTRQDDHRNPPTSTFVKFLDQGERLKSRYYPLNCDFSGGCLLKACRDGLTAWIRIYSSNKGQGEDYSVKDFDQQIASGIKVLERMVVNRPIDLAHH
ncbi:hypothetical protein NLM33_05110 [Bradyrhizobium sp. CCGUVB1N3]|uniref:hypothetical protein n=1 Tax=Bradyrhizobium sp. CCGUVB1N3 TaxID=2949629 RepID=UPI0020B39808|nr:hypothetical protein [Bradyrhizobium sp. CCGUVB1N3]MCP3469707.1 hypothetical protein [Bradyrhizobium sp. CCGUVB1N3]